MSGDPGGTPWRSWIAAESAAIHTAGRWRSVRPFDAAGTHGRLGTPGGGTGSAVVAFASNDYLGLSQHKVVKEAAAEAIERWGTGAGASRLIVGSRPIHHELEAALASARGAERALVFPTGYAANLGVLTALGGVGARIHSDALNHASIVDACRLAKAELAVHPHGDLDHLDAALSEDAHRGVRSIVVTDVVFSMDGDEAPLSLLAERCRHHGALLVLDEAHDVFHLADGVAAHGTDDGLDLVRVGTLSKSLGSLGGFVVGSTALVELIVNRARSFIFTTALPPGDAAAALAALAISGGDEGDELRATLRHRMAMLDPTAATPILPVVVGEERAALEAAAALLSHGILVPAIRPPTVPPGTSRLRIALSAAHTEDEVATLAERLQALGLVVAGPSAS